MEKYIKSLNEYNEVYKEALKEKKSEAGHLHDASEKKEQLITENLIRDQTIN